MHGYAVHVLDGRLAFDVRIRGKVTRIVSGQDVPRRFDFDATLTSDRMTLSVNGMVVAETPSPGLIPAQPQEPMNIGRDELSAAGDYTAPNPFAGNAVRVKVTPEM